MTVHGEVVLGLGSCVDYELDWDAGVLQELVDRFAIVPSELDRDAPIESERDLVRSVLAFVRDGTGGERFAARVDVLVAFAERFGFRATVGGTNLRAAIVLDRLGLTSTLHLVSTNETIRRLLPAGTGALCSAAEDSTDPHLIVQFPAGASIRVAGEVLCAPHPNRLIYVNDRPNREMALSPDLGRLLEKAGLFLISGLNTLQDDDLLARRLAELRAHLRHLPESALVLFEDAGYHRPELSTVVRDALIDRVDVHGLNEDELQGYVGHAVDLLDPDALAAAVAELRAVVPAPTLVVHTKYWCLAAGERAPRWRAALESATALAAARYLHGDAFTADDVAAVAGLPVHPGGARVAARLEAGLEAGLEAARPGELCVVPAFALSTPTPTTIGLGDAFVGGFVAGLVRGAPVTRGA